MRRDAPLARRDFVIALALVLIVFLLTLGQLTRGVPFWGDDNAAYLSEGIAIARGELAEQAARNLRLHPTPLRNETGEPGLVYVWGFPLLLSLVYRLTGFDMRNYSSVFYYKLPSLLSLSLLAGVLYLFFRRRLSRRASAPLALVFCLTADFADTANILYADVCFLFFSVLALLLLELFLDSAHTERGPALPLGIALGAALWYTYETRLNGIAVWIVALLAQLLFLAGDRARRNPRALARQLLPHLVFLALRLISERVLLPATSNMGDVGASGLRMALYNFCYYGYQTLLYFDSLTGFPLYIGMLLIVPCAVGILWQGFRRENLPYTLLLIGTYAVNISLPYQQSLRYLYGVLPLLALYMAWGLQWLWRRIAARLRARVRRALPRALTAALALLVTAHALLGCWQNLSAQRMPPSPRGQEMYSPQAVDMYRYIQDNTGPGAVIACEKPRAVYLNTARMGFRPLSPEQVADGADYLLLLREGDSPDAELEGRLRLVHAARELALYRVE